MDAKELHDWFTGPSPISDMDAEDKQTILRALSLLAAAEANDGTTPETDAAARWLPNDHGGRARVVPVDVACYLERERNGLAAEVARLKAHAKAMAEHWEKDDTMNMMKSAVDAYRRDYPEGTK